MFNRDFEKLFKDFMSKDDRMAESNNTVNKEDVDKLFDKLRNSRSKDASIIMKKTSSGMVEIRMNAGTVDVMVLVGMLIFQMSSSDDEAEVILDGIEKAYELLKESGFSK